MFNTYTNSVLWPIRSRNYHDYCSLLPERSETYRFSKLSTSSRCCCDSSRSRCCCCCSTPSSSSFVKPKVSINPAFVLYGLRQSTLIQWPSFRRRLLVGVGVGGSRLLGCEDDVHCCDSEVYSSCGVTRRNRRFRLRASDESKEWCDRRWPDDVEAMISFLSEEMIDEDRNWSSVSRIQERKKVRSGDEFHGGNVRKVKVEGNYTSSNGRFTRRNKKERLERPEGFGRQEYKRNGNRENVKLEEKHDCEHCGGRKKNSQLESEAQRSSKLVTGDSIGKTYRRKEEREVRPIRTKSSSCSSYYSLASSGDFRSDTEDGEEDVEFHRENQRSSEKKFVQQSTTGSKSRKEVSQMQSGRKRDETANGMGSSYRKQVFEEGENSNQAVILNQRRRRKQFSQTGNKVSESTGNCDEDMEIHEIHVNDAETNSQNQKIYGEREDNRVHSIVYDSERENIESSQQQLKERLGARYSSEERVSEMSRRTEYSNSQEEGIYVLQNFPEATNSQQPPVEERIPKQDGMRTSTERFSKISEVHDINIENTYVSQSEGQIRNQEVHAGFVSGLQSEGRQQDYHIQQSPSPKMQSDRNSVSVSHTSDTVGYTEINRKSEKRLIGQGSTTIVEMDSKAGKNGAWKDSRLDHANSIRKGQKALGSQSSQKKLSEEASSSQSVGINVLQNFPEATNNQQPPVEERISKQDGMRMSTERFSRISEVHDININNTYVSQSEDQIRNQEVHAGFVSGLQSEGRQQDYHIIQSPSPKIQSDRTSVVSHTSDAVRYTEINRKSEKRLTGQGSTTIVDMDSKAEKNGAWKDSRIDHANSTREGQKALGSQSSQKKLSEEASSSQSSLTFVSGNRMQLVDLVSEEMQGPGTTLIPPPSQLVSRGSGQSYGTVGASIQEISQGTSETGYTTAFEHPGEGAFVNSQSAGELMRFTTHEDALGSAHRLQQSSQELIGEFVKKAKHEVSRSETEEQRAESNQLKRRDSKRSSGGSGAKGPPEEMWVTDSAQGTPQPGATEGNAAEENAILKRSGRSLWSVIADIARLRWGSRAGSPASSAKPTGKSSPNESVSSATWFSGREHDGSSDDNTKPDRILSQEAASPHQLEVSQTSSRSQFESSDATELKQRFGRPEGVVSTPSSTILEGGFASYRTPSTSGNQNVGADEEEGRDFEIRLSETASTEVPLRLPSRNLKRSPAIKDPSESSPTELSGDQNVTVGEGRRYQVRVPEIDAVEKPLVFPVRNLRSPVVKEPSKSGPSRLSGSSSLREQVEQKQPLSAKSQEETGTISTGSPLIQRKLQRNKQVVRDSFEEWEEAYRVEAERRTVDEIFMREALVEAKKAADIWEVPVGAVLVHDGKIIARGFNLVEDLRDSTAHAEMICIREGSKVLRSWRLAETTLYVTLEPCPMCAGAILQARVNTLVWGAPNKLLGADGSWIRLFPGGEGSEVSEKPPPPVHPFHPKMTIRRGVLESECAQTMQQFFQLRRKKKDKNSDPPAPTDQHHHHHPSKLLNKMHQILPFFCL